MALYHDNLDTPSDVLPPRRLFVSRSAANATLARNSDVNSAVLTVKDFGGPV